MVSFGANPISAALKQAMTQITGKSAGDDHQAMLQALGMGQSQAALQGALHDLGQGNLAGYQKNLFEAFTGVDPGRIGAGMCQSQHMGSPSSCMAQRYDRMDLAKCTKGGLGAMLGGFALGGPLGAFIGNKLSKRSKAKSLERRLNNNPAFRAQFEAAVGGRYVPDFRNDGKITIARGNFGLPGMNPGILGALGGNPIAGSALSGLARMMGNAANMMQSFGMGPAGMPGGSFGGFGVGPGGTMPWGNNPNEHGAKSSFGMGPQKPGSAMSRLPPNATFEDLVEAFMSDTVKEFREEIKEEMRKLQKSNETNGGDKAGGRRGYGGALGGIGQIAGGALGGVFGGPIGASLGSQLGGAVGGALGGGGAGGAKGGGGQWDNLNKIDDKSDSRQDMMEAVKNLMNKLQQMQQAMSNVLNTMHQGAMNAVRNIRG